MFEIFKLSVAIYITGFTVHRFIELSVFTKFSYEIGQRLGRSISGGPVMRCSISIVA